LLQTFISSPEMSYMGSAFMPNGVTIPFFLMH